MHTSNVWDVNEPIVFEIYVTNPNDGLGISGITTMEITVTRDSDGRYWNGTTWTLSRSVLSPTEPDAVYQAGRYNYTLSALANNRADRYIIYASVNIPNVIVAESYEAHVSKQQTVKVYESEPA